MRQLTVSKIVKVDDVGKVVGEERLSYNEEDVKTLLELPEADANEGIVPSMDKNGRLKKTKCNAVNRPISLEGRKEKLRKYGYPEEHITSLLEQNCVGLV